MRRARAAADERTERMLPMRPLTSAPSEEILRPVAPWFVLTTLVLGIVGNLLPLEGVAASFKPDFLALVILYWCIQEPRLVGVGTAWFLGLVMDVADATVFGQHALAYAVLAYAAEYFRRRVLRFPLWQQAAQVLLLLLFCAGLVVLVRLVGGAPPPRWTYVVGSLTGALLWPLFSVMLQWPQRPPRSRSEV
jgi:rod shape-determining protein MreD